MITAKIRENQRGFAHLALFGLLFVAIVGVLGFVGYNAWQKQEANAGGADTVGQTSEKPTASKKAITIQYSDWGTLRDGAKLGKDSSNNNVVVFPIAEGQAVTNSTVKKMDAPLKKLQDFVLANIGKKAKACVIARTTAKKAGRLDVQIWNINKGAKKDMQFSSVYEESCLVFEISEKVNDINNVPAIVIINRDFDGKKYVGKVFLKKVTLELVN